MIFAGVRLWILLLIFHGKCDCFCTDILGFLVGIQIWGCGDLFPWIWRQMSRSTADAQILRKMFCLSKFCVKWRSQSTRCWIQNKTKQKGKRNSLWQRCTTEVRLALWCCKAAFQHAEIVCCFPVWENSLSTGLLAADYKWKWNERIRIIKMIRSMSFCHCSSFLWNIIHSCCAEIDVTGVQVLLSGSL